jgi:hypothetical protein
MKKIDLEKNCLDLEYQKNLQLLNSILITSSGSLIAYLSGLILNISQWREYSLIVFGILLISILVYNKTNNNLKLLSNKIKTLKIE